MLAILDLKDMDCSELSSTGRLCEPPSHHVDEINEVSNEIEVCRNILCGFYIHLFTTSVRYYGSYRICCKHIVGYLAEITRGGPIRSFMFVKLWVHLFAFKSPASQLSPFLRKFTSIKMASTGSGLLHCQRDAYALEGVSKVVACIKSESPASSIYHVTLEDSVLYPEGGGQPWDLGSVNGIDVEKVVKGPGSNKEIVVDLKQPVEVGAEVVCKVDWNRRYDFMQQHTAQVSSSCACVSCICTVCLTRILATIIL